MEKRFPGFSIEYVYGADDPGVALSLCEKYNIAASASEDEAIEKSDAIVITYRKGSMHHSAAMKALKAGKPVFVDKPFTTKTEDAKEIADCASAGGLLLTGGSSLKNLPILPEIKKDIKPGSTVVITFAADPKSDYDGYWFYGAHTAEICITLCGEDFASASSFRNGDAVVSIVQYPDLQCIIITAPNAPDVKIAVANDGKTTCYHAPLNYQSICPEEFANMLISRKAPRNASFYVKATELLEKIIESAGL
jgi:hypothetical protein